MENLKKETIKAINTQPRTQGIRKLFLLMNQYPQPQYSHDMMKVSCLGLLEIEHDWVNLKKYVIEWKMVKKEGQKLLKRMRQRVLVDDDGVLETIHDERAREKYIIEQLDEMFQKYWQFNSPKRQAPNYQQKITKKGSKGILVKKIENNLENRQKQNEHMSNVGQLDVEPDEKKEIKYRESAVPAPQARTLKLNIGSFGQNTKKTFETKSASLNFVQNQETKKSYDSEQLFVQNPQKNQQIRLNIPHEEDLFENPPQNLEKIIIEKPKLKFKDDKNIQESLPQNENEDIDFQMSAVKTRQQPQFNSKAFQNANSHFDRKNSDLCDNSFMDFAEQFAFRTAEKKSHMQEQIMKMPSPKSSRKNIEFEEEQISKQKQAEKKLMFRNFLTPEKLALIEMDTPFKDPFRKIFQKQGTTALQMLNQALKSM